MTFTATHARAFAGNDISVVVHCLGDENIVSISVVFDGHDLVDTELPPGTEVYERIFPQAGEAGPGTEHNLTVTAVDQAGKQHASVTCWTDVQ